MDNEVPARFRLPLEDSVQFQGFWNRMGKTLGLAFTRPFEFFERVPAGEGLGRPIGLMLLLSAPLYLFLSIYPVIFGAMDFLTRLHPEAGARPPFGWISIGCLGAILLAPFAQILGAFFSGYVMYAFLRLWGVHDPALTLEQDMRAWIYANGFLALAAWTPLGPIAMAGVVVMAGLGFARMHRVEAWRGVGAALSALALGFMLVVGSFIGFIVFVGHMASRDQARQMPRSAFTPLMPSPGHSPEEVLNLHLEQARLTLNGLSGSCPSADAAIDRALVLLATNYPRNGNPFEPSRPGFRKGEPEAPGEVGLTAEEYYPSPLPGPHRAVIIRAWTRTGTVKRVVLV